MAKRAGILLMLALIAPLSQAAGNCIPLRFGYMDQDRPPYWMGDGDKVPEPPGAAVDLVRDAVMGSGFNCLPTLVRLPVARLKVALEAGDIDMSTLGEQPSYPPEIALPRDKDGNVDRNRALHNTVVVLVRARDKLPASTNPMEYFRGKPLGATQGNAYTARLRESGLTIDDGARDLDRNIEKLKLGRVDGVLASLVKPEHLTATLKRYKGAIVQLPQPLINTRLWLAFNAGYYRAHHDQVEALWTWLDTNRGRLGYVMQKYRKQD
ncbi:hypothetical protein [Duganella sp. Dugasp56]|uniref:hypothetical protein n=1 Tax=Duganella sp. Dugasp56 TaxID=3243046 RepID=UPI0039AE9EBC